MNILDVNTVNLRNLYPTAIGQSVSQSGTSSNQMPSQGGTMPQTSAPNAAPDAVSYAASIGGQSSALVGGLVFLGLLVTLMFIAKRVGTVDEFSNIKLSAFNVMVMSLAALVGLPVWKYIFTRVPVPGLSTWALAA